MDIELASVSHATGLSHYYQNNTKHLEEWEPRREDRYHEVGKWQNRLEEWGEEFAKGHAVHFLGVNTSSGEVMAICSLTNISRGVFHACNMGYSVSQEWQGRGYMAILVEHSVQFAFKKLELNRVMANYMPGNHRSGHLLERLGFTTEGIAKRYLKINGVWQDHVLTSRTNPKTI